MCIHDLDVRMGPWVLGRVCSLWREIALEICRPLWTSLDIALNNPTGHHSEKYSADVLREYLRRSGGQPLDITFLFAYRRSPRDEDLPEMTKLLNIVVEESYRWKSLSLDMSGRMLLSECVLSSLARARGRLPLLQRMDFGPCQDLSDIDIILNSAPLLSDISTTFDLNAERIPWHQLTRYVHDYGYQVANYSWIFRNAPNLVECRIEPAHYHTNSSEHVTLSHLRHLHVGATGPLDLLTAPYLQSISVPYCDAHVISFIRRAPCLHTLTITAPIHGRDLIPFLDGLQAIETFTALEIDVDDAFIAEFTRPNVLPKLKSLVLECVQTADMTPFTVALMFSLVEKRRHGALRFAMISMDKQTQCCGWEERATTLKKDGYIIDFV
ncbi:hypothetical protein CPB85DRAFT_1268928 [Mucidula mucida]|nr:hypothetical protein CPB85DRAFT_1268928 [Mucidula mucida]